MLCYVTAFQMKLKELENELKYFTELSCTNTYKKDTPQKLEITIKRLDNLNNEKYERSWIMSLSMPRLTETVLQYKT